MNRKAFFASLRRRESGVFGTSLSQKQVDGLNALLDSCIRNGVSDPWGAALIAANVYHETGGYMLPIKETVQRYHKDKNPSDATVIARLDRAWAKGQLTWVKSPYWRDGWFGRGPVQVTHKRNYIKMGSRLGIDLVKRPEKLLEPATGADSAVIGMVEGLYTGKKISDYVLPRDLSNKPDTHPRRIINGRDGTDADIAKYTRAFHAALMAAGYSKVSGESLTADKPPQKTAQQKKAPAGVAATAGAGVVAAGVTLWAKWAEFTSWLGGLFQ
ncbi:hypothetical protein [Pseudohoeflea coraliihabitans]|uniref:Glycoside hydrolase family 19 catalytic domain-containing protein n=1 Tax=Pseudohoeflea coraliihabitans TaxID=2860393 RepID=A0ABS6WUG6_9HYPH|nr:hypothetical protein [Pseudohoeflea sp. DP4N28-3]MBW3099273.1 hypothetical protein [Pseudohoeflea sp. DP4N28-3]